MIPLLLSKQQCNRHWSMREDSRHNLY